MKLFSRCIRLLRYQRESKKWPIVYPDGLVIDHAGKRLPSEYWHLLNYRSHANFYRFVQQFVPGKRVVDVGCGSGYGCMILKDGGAAHVSGTDFSGVALRYAREQYRSDGIEFVRQNALRMKQYREGAFDIAASSELFHYLFNYSLEERCIKEMKRITTRGGWIILGIPNREVVREDGVPFEMVETFIARHFESYVIFENALQPFGKYIPLWEERLRAKKHGVIVTQHVERDQFVNKTFFTPKFKKGMDPRADYHFQDRKIDLSLLQNVNSWIVIAVNGQMTSNPIET